MSSILYYQAIILQFELKANLRQLNRSVRGSCQWLGSLDVVLSHWTKSLRNAQETLWVSLYRVSGLQGPGQLFTLGCSAQVWNQLRPQYGVCHRNFTRNCTSGSFLDARIYSLNEDLLWVKGLQIRHQRISLRDLQCHHKRTFRWNHHSTSLDHFFLTNQTINSNCEFSFRSLPISFQRLILERRLPPKLKLLLRQ